MEYQIRLAGPKPDMATLQGALLALDPAAMMAIDTSGRLMRVATVLTSSELGELFARNGLVLPAGALEPLPSVCCGGCGG